jgi:Domain of unknown function (DUF222)
VASKRAPLQIHGRAERSAGYEDCGLRASYQVPVVHERRLTETIGPITASVSATERETAEAELARHAWSFNFTSLHRIGQHILAHLDPDGPEPRDEPERAGTPLHNPLRC